jgi:hypothetical protein
MKKLIPAVLLLTILAGCNKKPDTKPEKNVITPQQQIHFAAIAIASDLFEKGVKSDFSALVPGINLAGHIMDADSIITDMARNPEKAKDKYSNLLRKKIRIQGIVEVGTDFANNQFEFHRRNFKERGYEYGIFSLKVRFDTKKYPHENYPVVPKEQARIRVQLSACHEKSHLDKAIDAFIKVGKQLNVTKR